MSRIYIDLGNRFHGGLTTGYVVVSLPEQSDIF